MSFPRYPKYKDSGVEWLGQVPEHWDVTALKRGFQVTLGKMLQSESSDCDDELLPYLRAANIQWEGIEATDIKQMWMSRKDREQLRLEYGDLLVSEGGDVGRSCLWKDELSECYFQNSVNRVRALECNSNSYLRYWMSGIKDKGYIDVLCNKSTIAHFTAEKVAAIPVPFPPPAEQTRIAAFLDRETAKIDALVAEQRRLMELLKEKRQAVISHAVTKGLNPKAKLKPSGIEWLGDVPAHWDIRRLYHLANFESGMAHEPFVDDLGEFICVNSRFISTGGESRKFCTQNLSPTKKNDVLMVMSDLPNGRALAKAFFVSDEAPYAVNQRVGIISPKAACPRFLYYYLDRNPGFLLHDDGMNQTHLWNDLFKKFPTLAPPLHEQEEIADFVTTETAKFDALTAEAQRAVDLLLERRTALISAAVTGQIDVRELALAPEELQQMAKSPAS